MGTKAWTRRMMIVLIVAALTGLMYQSAALAASTYKVKNTCKLYSKLSKKAKTLKIRRTL